MNKKWKRIGIIAFFMLFIMTIASSILLYISLRFVVVKGESMENTIHDGDTFLVNRIAYKWQRPDYNDIVILDVPTIKGHELYIKRVVGLPGDVIEVRGRDFYRNGRYVNEPYVKEIMRPDHLKITVPQKHIFVMGDNRNHSIDSRIFHSINYEEDVKSIILYKIN